MKMHLSFVFLFTLSLTVFFSSPSATASTGDVEGIVKSYFPGSSLVFGPMRMGYISAYSNSIPLYPSQSITLNGNNLPSDMSVCFVDNILTNFPTLSSAIGIGKRMYVHDNRSFAQMFGIYNTDRMIEAEILSVNLASNSVVVKYTLKNGLGGASFNPGSPVDTTFTINFNPSDVIKYEGQLASAAQALVAGRSLRYYAARNQTIMAFTPSALDLGSRAVRESGGNKHFSFVQEGFLHGYNGQNAYFSEQRNGRWHMAFKEAAINQGHMIDGHYVNSVGASARPGDKIVFIPYAQPGNGLNTKVTLVRPMDDESIEGYVKSLVGNQLVLTVTLCPTGRPQDVITKDTTITLASNAAYLLNGQTGSNATSALQVGNFVRLLKPWSGGLLVRDTDQNRMTIASAPPVSPFFVSDGGSPLSNAPELIRDNILWKQVDTIFATEREFVTFEVEYMTMGSTSLTWFKDGVKVPGARTVNYTRRVSLSDDGSHFWAVASNTAGNDTSRAIVLKVAPDQRALTITGGAIASSTQLLLTFSQPVKAGAFANSAENSTNYTISGGITVGAVSLTGDQRTVVLGVSALTAGNSYTITVNNVEDLAQTANQVASNSQITLNYKAQFRFLRTWMKGPAGSLTPRAAEIRFKENSISYGPGFTYFGPAPNPGRGFDNNGSSYVQNSTFTKWVGLDLGAGSGILPDTVAYQMWAGNGRDATGIVAEGTNDTLTSNWVLILDTSFVLMNGQSYQIPTNVTNISPNDILSGAKNTQTISFPQIPDQLLTANYTVNASASSGLPVSFRVIEGAAQVNASNALVMYDTGRVTIQAYQDGDTGFYAALPVEVSFNITDTSAPPLLSSVLVSPKTASVNVNSSFQFQFTARDQTNTTILPKPAATWSISSMDHSISGTGLLSTSAVSGTYEVYVTVSQGGITLSDTAIVTVNNATALLDKSSEEQVFIYPNPTTGSFSIKGFKGEAHMTLFDCQGKKLGIQTVEAEETLNFKSLPSGVYILRLEQAGSVSNHRLVVE